jgi:hypothetical protein
MGFSAEEEERRGVLTRAEAECMDTINSGEGRQASAFSEGGRMK